MNKKKKQLVQHEPIAKWFGVRISFYAIWYADRNHVILMKSERGTNDMYRVSTMNYYLIKQFEIFACITVYCTLRTWFFRFSLLIIDNNNWTHTQKIHFGYRPLAFFQRKSKTEKECTSGKWTSIFSVSK